VNLKRHANEVWILPLRRRMMHNHGKIAQEREVAGEAWNPVRVAFELKIIA
jgi:hypothetical protein